MANSEAKDLMDIGRHCTVPTCMQIDFLPFKCDCCSKTFCLDHRTYASHECPAAKNKDTEVIVCPICAKGVRLRANEDPNIVFEHHTRTDCDPSNYQRVHNKPRCSAPGCREKLTTINTYTCKTCGLKVCLKHRDVDDHKCQGKAMLLQAATQRQQAGVMATVTSWFSSQQPSQASSSQQRPSSSSSSSAAAAAAEARAARYAPKAGSTAPKPAAPPKPTPATSALLRDPGNTLRGTAAARRTQWEQQQQASLPELCQQCGMRFADAAQLVQHYERQHSGQAAGAPAAAAGGAEMFPCPKCGVQFADAVQLLQHHEGCGTGLLRGLLNNLGWK